jgi:hypothetical protein
MLELHEIIRSEITCAKKLQANLGMISDPDLKVFMQSSLQAKKAVINKYHDIYDQSIQRNKG